MVRVFGFCWSPRLIPEKFAQLATLVDALLLKKSPLPCLLRWLLRLSSCRFDSLSKSLHLGFQCSLLHLLWPSRRLVEHHPLILSLRSLKFAANSCIPSFASQLWVFHPYNSGVKSIAVKCRLTIIGCQVVAWSLLKKLWCLAGSEALLIVFRACLFDHGLYRLSWKARSTSIRGAFSRLHHKRLES